VRSDSVVSVNGPEGREGARSSIQLSTWLYTGASVTMREHEKGQNRFRKARR